MKRISITLTAVLALAGLSACTEKPQTGGGVKQDKYTIADGHAATHRLWDHAQSRRARSVYDFVVGG